MAFARLKCPDPKCSWELVVHPGMTQEIAAVQFREHQLQAGHFPPMIPFELLWKVLTDTPD
jgi:hypothetical protein